MQRLRTPLLALALAAGAALPCAAQQTMSPQPSGGMSSGDAAHLDAMSREHANHTPAANASAEVAPRQEVTAREVVYGTVDNKPVRGYLASPARNSRGMPGIVMIHEWWGLNDNIKTMARRLAGEGYNVLAVDMYGGRVAADPQQARAYMGDVMANTGGGASNLRSAAEFLRQRTQATRVGVVGWCFGGGWALQSALFMPDEVDATVVYYGRAVTDRDRLANLDSPLLGLFGAQDQGIPVAQVREMESMLKELGKDVTIQVYEGADHAFANPSGQAYNAAAADDAWRRTTEFFARNLKTPPATAAR